MDADVEMAGVGIHNAKIIKSKQITTTIPSWAYKFLLGFIMQK